MTFHTRRFSSPRHHARKRAPWPPSLALAILTLTACRGWNPGMDVLRRPESVAVDSQGFIYLTDDGPVVKRIAPDGMVTAFRCGRGWVSAMPSAFPRAAALAAGAAGEVWVTAGDRIYRLDPAGGCACVGGGQGFTDGSGPAVRFGNAAGVASDPDGGVVVADSANGTLRGITRDGLALTIAGRARTPPAERFADGPRETARFTAPQALARDAQGNFFVADGRGAVRVIRRDGEVRTLAGHPSRSGLADGPGPEARFSDPRGLAVDTAGNVFVADRDNNRIRVLSPEGQVTTLAGRGDRPGDEDGTAGVARFSAPSGVALLADGALIVADSGNACLRRVARDGTVTTWPGTKRAPARTNMALTGSSAVSFLDPPLPSDFGARPPPPSPPDRAIAYDAGRDAGGQTTDLWTIPATGGEPRRIAEFAREPAWSPDGARLAYTTAYGLVVAEIGPHDSAVAVQPFTAGYDYDPAWAPDGSAIAFVRGDAPPHLQVVQSQGFIVLSLGAEAVNGRAPAWSPDGRWIAFLAINPAGTDLRIAAGGGSSERVVAIVAAAVHRPGLGAPVWSPDGAFLLVASSRDDEHTLSLYLIEGKRPGRQRRVGTKPVLSIAGWSPRGDRVAAVFGASEGDASATLEVLHPDGSGAVIVARGAQRAAWSPDGERLAFTTRHDGRWSLETARADGSDRQVLGSGANPYGNLAWQP